MIEELLTLVGLAATLFFAIVLLFAPAVLEVIKPKDLGPRHIPQLTVEPAFLRSTSFSVTLSCASEFNLQPFGGWNNFSNINTNWYTTYATLLE